MDIAGFQANSFVDYKGHIAAVVFVPHCNMRCWYCHNEGILDDPELLDEETILNKVEANKLFLDGVVISGGEPTLQQDLYEFILKIKAIGLDVKLDTNGKRPDVIKSLIGLNALDYIAMDVKAPLDKYFKVTPTTSESAEVLKKSIDIIMASNVDYEFRMTVIPQLTIEEIVDAAKTIKGAKAFYLQQYVDRKGFSPHPPQFFKEAQKECEKHVPTFLRGI